MLRIISLKIFILLLLSINVGFVLSQNGNLSISEKQFDFGDIKEGEIVSKTIEISNNSKTPVVINDVKTQCGCTTTEVGKEPILPNQSISIDIKFDSSDKHGFVRKSVTLVTTEGNIPIVFVANVL